jgi:hypothetical protein
VQGSLLQVDADGRQVPGTALRRTIPVEYVVSVLTVLVIGDTGAIGEWHLLLLDHVATAFFSWQEKRPESLVAGRRTWRRIGLAARWEHGCECCRYPALQTLDRRVTVHPCRSSTMHTCR